MISEARFDLGFAKSSIVGKEPNKPRAVSDTIKNKRANGPASNSQTQRINFLSGPCPLFSVVFFLGTPQKLLHAKVTKHAHSSRYYFLLYEERNFTWWLSVNDFSSLGIDVGTAIAQDIVLNADFFGQKKALGQFFLSVSFFATCSMFSEVFNNSAHAASTREICSRLYG